VICPYKLTSDDGPGSFPNPTKFHVFPEMESESVPSSNPVSMLCSTLPLIKHQPRISLGLGIVYANRPLHDIRILTCKVLLHGQIERTKNSMRKSKNAHNGATGIYSISSRIVEIIIRPVIRKLI
jgi:hypothetical protein